MWILKDGFLFDDAFPFLHFVTTKALGDMKSAPAREKVCSLMGVDPSLLVLARQVHGSRAAAARASDSGKTFEDTDALATAEKKLSIAVMTADCVPVFIGQRGRAVAVAHAGWRGLKAGVLGETVKLMKAEFGLDPSAASASIGPHICRDCYEIGAELREAFGLASGQPRFDLSAEAAAQLKAAGVGDISDSGRCTMHEEGLFFSHRRDKTAARIMSLARF